MPSFGPVAIPTEMQTWTFPNTAATGKAKLARFGCQYVAQILDRLYSDVLTSFLWNGEGEADLTVALLSLHQQ